MKPTNAHQRIMTTLLVITLLALPGVTLGYICGDIDGGDNGTDIADLVWLVDYMFTGGAAPPDMGAANVDGLNGIDISDLVYLVDYMFTGGPEPTCAPINNDLTYIVVGTDQAACYNNSTEIACPDSGQPFYGQNGRYQGNPPSYLDNGDSTITDLVTGLMWQKSADMDGDGVIDATDKVTYDQAVAGASSFNLAGYTDWRLPTIKEQYSLILFSGLDPSGYEGDPGLLVPFIDTAYFDFGWGDESAGERLINAQYVSITKYDTTTMINDETAFGVNFADGHIKGYGLTLFGSDKTFYVKYVRGNTSYGINDFVDNSDGTITDQATGLMWMKTDSDSALNWEAALDYAENLVHAGHANWRLPSVKELQSIVDYTRTPLTTNSAAIDPLFYCSEITDEGGGTDYPHYWSNSTHENMVNGGSAAYISFGQAFGWMQIPPGSPWQLLDVHGAGAQRSDPKWGDPADWPYGHGPQGDVIRIYNYVRCVRDAE